MACLAQAVARQTPLPYSHPPATQIFKSKIIKKNKKAKKLFEGFLK